MPFEKARTSLLNITDRLRKVLGSAGEIPLELSKDLIPIVIAADLREPGSSPFRGRRFCFAPPAAVIASNFGWIVQFQTDVVITQVLLSTATTGGAGRWFLWSLPPDVNPATAPTLAGGQWTDNRLTNAGERVPILTTGDVSVNLTTETLPTSLVMLASLSAAVNFNLAMPVEWMFPSGTKILLRTSAGAVNESTFAIYGKIF